MISWITGNLVIGHSVSITIYRNAHHIHFVINAFDVQNYYVYKTTIRK